MLPATLGLVGAVPLTDGIYASPVVADGKVYRDRRLGRRLRASTPQTLQGALDVRHPRRTGQLQQRRRAGRDRQVSACRHDGRLLLRPRPRQRAQSSARSTAASRSSPRPAAGDRPRLLRDARRAGSTPSKPDGELAWTWDFVKEVVKFDGNRWSGEDWLKDRKDRVTWQDHFVCSRDICLIGKTVVMPAGGRTVFLDDAGAAPQLRAVGEIPDLRRHRVSRHVRPKRRCRRQRLRAVAPPRQRRAGRNPASSTATARCRPISSRAPKRRSTCPAC